MTDSAEIERLEQRLRAIYEGDHERGCAGRTYDCSCGFDAATWATAKDAADALKALREENERWKEMVRVAERDAYDECAEIARDRMPAVQCCSVEPVVQACEDIAATIEARRDEVCR